MGTTAIKPTQHYPPQLRHVATLPWEIRNSIFLQILSKYGRKHSMTINGTYSLVSLGLTAYTLILSCDHITQPDSTKLNSTGVGCCGHSAGQLS